MKLLRELGRGSYSVIYLGQDTSTDGASPLIAVKKFHDDPSETCPELQHEKLMLELCRDCPGVIKLHRTHVEDAGATACLVLEYFPMDLRQFLDRRQRICGALLRQMTRQLLETLAWLHDASRLIIHGDIKPANLLVQRNRPLTLCDFSSSLLAGSLEHNETPPNSICTLWYRAPECLQGRSFGTSLDVWSAGCVIYEMAQGEPFCQGHCESGQLTLLDHAMSLPTTVLFGPTLHKEEPELVALLKRMLTWDPAKRITAAEALQSRYFR